MVSVPPGNTLCANADEMNVVEDNTKMDAAITQREEFRDLDMFPTPRRRPWRLFALNVIFAFECPQRRLCPLFYAQFYEVFFGKRLRKS